MGHVSPEHEKGQPSKEKLSGIRGEYCRHVISPQNPTFLFASIAALQYCRPAETLKGVSQLALS